MKQSSLRGEFGIAGWSAVADFLRCAPGKVLRVSAPSTALEALRKLAEQYADAARSRHIEWSSPSERSPANSHGSRADIRALVSLEALSFSHWQPPLGAIDSPLTLCVLDHLTDPQNVGAIVRTCSFFGIRWILVPERRQSLLTESAVRVSQGGFATVQLLYCTNLGATLEQLRSKFNFSILGTAVEGQPIHQQHTTLPRRRALVLGNEETGLSGPVRRRCDALLSIARHPTPAPGATTALPTGTQPVAGVQSLNVAAAAAILISALA